MIFGQRIQIERTPVESIFNIGVMVVTAAAEVFQEPIDVHPVSTITRLPSFLILRALSLAFP